MLQPDILLTNPPPSSLDLGMPQHPAVSRPSPIIPGYFLVFLYRLEVGGEGYWSPYFADLGKYNVDVFKTSLYGFPW